MDSGIKMFISMKTFIVFNKFEIAYKQLSNASEVQYWQKQANHKPISFKSTAWGFTCSLRDTIYIRHSDSLIWFLVK